MRSTKRRMTVSLFALLICCVMLAGTTFAWFTDTATNSGNRIQAGTLKVDLLKYTDGEYASIKDGEGDIFSPDGNGINWEPNKTEIVHLAVRNNGTLALKYQLLLKVVGAAALPDTHSLLDVLEAVVIPETEAYDGTGYGTASTWETLSAGKDIISLNELAQGEMTLLEHDTPVMPGDDSLSYVTLAVHMDKQAGNDYQNGAAEGVDFDVTLLATQVESEFDSFGNIYDKDADLYNAEENEPGETVLVKSTADINDFVADGKTPTFVLMNDIEGNVSLNYLANFDFSGHTWTGNLSITSTEKGTIYIGDYVAFDPDTTDWGKNPAGYLNGNLTITAGNASVGLDIDVEEGTINEVALHSMRIGGRIKTMSVAKARIILTDTAKITTLEKVENADTDNIIIQTTGDALLTGTDGIIETLDPELDECVINKISNAAGLAAMEGGKRYQLANDITVGKNDITTTYKEGRYSNIKYSGAIELDLDLNGKTVTFEGDATHIFGIELTNGAKLTVSNSIGSGKLTTSSAEQLIHCWDNGHFVLESGTIENTMASSSATAITVKKGSSVTINSGSVLGTGHAISGNGNTGNGGVEININGGVVKAPEAIYMPNDGTINVSGGTIVGTAKGIDMRKGTLNMSGGTVFATAPRVLLSNTDLNGKDDYNGAIFALKPADTNTNAYYGAIDINITGGKISNANGDAVALIQEIPLSDSRLNEDGYKINYSQSGATISGGILKLQSVTNASALNSVLGAGAVNGTTYVLEAGDYTSATIPVQKNIAVIGKDDVKITVAGGDAFKITSGANVQVENVTVSATGEGSAKGQAFNIVSAGTVDLKNIKIIDAGKGGINVNQSTVNASGIDISGTNWGGINVDIGAGEHKADSVLNLSGTNSIGGGKDGSNSGQIWAELSNFYNADGTKKDDPTAKVTVPKEFSRAFGTKGGDSPNMIVCGTYDQMKAYNLPEQFVVWYTGNADPESFGGALWDGSLDEDGLANNTDETAKTVKIESEGQLAALAKNVNGGNNYAGYTVSLKADLNLANKNWTPIGEDEAFMGTFDGENHTIRNLKVNYSGTDGEYRAGLFGSVIGTLKNIKLNNVDIKGTHYSAALCPYAYAKIDNIHVSGANIVAIPNASNGTYDNGDKVGVISGLQSSGSVTNCSVSNCSVRGFRDIGGLIGCLQKDGTVPVVTNNTVKDTKITLDHATNWYEKTPIDTAGEIVGRLNSGLTVDASNTFTNVTIDTIELK